MPIQIKVSVDSSIVTLDFSHIEIEHDLLVERVNEIVPVLAGAIEADCARLRVDDAVHERILPLILAKDMTYQACLHRALAEIVGVIDVIDGRLTAQQMRYPEFDGGSGLND